MFSDQQQMDIDSKNPKSPAAGNTTPLPPELNHGGGGTWGRAPMIRHEHEHVQVLTRPRLHDMLSHNVHRAHFFHLFWLAVPPGHHMQPPPAQAGGPSLDPPQQAATPHPLLGAASSAWQACGRVGPPSAAAVPHGGSVDPDEIRATTSLGAAAAAVRQVVIRQVVIDLIRDR